MSTPQGLMAAQFIMAQKYIDAFAQTAKKDNTFIIQQDINFVKGAVNESLHLLPKKKGHN